MIKVITASPDFRTEVLNYVLVKRIDGKFFKYSVAVFQHIMVITYASLPLMCLKTNQKKWSDKDHRSGSGARIVQRRQQHGGKNCDHHYSATLIFKK